MIVMLVRSHVYIYDHSRVMSTTIRETCVRPFASRVYNHSRVMSKIAVMRNRFTPTRIYYHKMGKDCIIHLYNLCASMFGLASIVISFYLDDYGFSVFRLVLGGILLLFHMGVLNTGRYFGLCLSSCGRKTTNVEPISNVGRPSVDSEKKPMCCMGVMLEKNYETKTRICTFFITCVILSIGSYNGVIVYRHGVRVINGVDICTCLPLLIALSIRFYKPYLYIFEQNWTI